MSALPQHEWWQPKMVENLAALLWLVHKPASVNPNRAWYSLTSQYNKALKRDLRKSAASPLAQRCIA